IGWLRHRTVGGRVVGLLFVGPGFLSILCISYIYAAYGNVGIVAGLVFGVKATVLSIVIQALPPPSSHELQNHVTVSTAD
ncbi:chromate transporter, partial [Rhizobium ruizarguesonis]